MIVMFGLCRETLQVSWYGGFDSNNTDNWVEKSVLDKEVRTKSAQKNQMTSIYVT